MPFQVQCTEEQPDTSSPLGNYLQINHPTAYMKVDLNYLLSFVWFLLLQRAAQNSPFFHFSLGKVLFLLFLCVTFSWTSQNLLLLCWDNLKNWKLYSKDGKEHCQLWHKNLSCFFFFFFPVNPNIYHFCFLSLLFMSTELLSSLISKVWVRIFLSATDSSKSNNVLPCSCLYVLCSPHILALKMLDPISSTGNGHLQHACKLSVVCNLLIRSQIVYTSKILFLCSNYLL